MIERPENHHKASSADKPMPENSGASDPPLSDANADTRGDSDEAPQPEPSIDAQSSSAPAPQPDAEVEPQTPNETDADKADVGTSKKAGSKAGSNAQRQRRKNSRTDKRAKAASVGATGGLGNATANEGGPMLPYLQGCHIEPAPLPPNGTLPPRLAPLFADTLSVAAVLATTTAAAGQRVQLATDKDGRGGALALRVAVIGEERQLPRAVTPVLEAAYLLERQDVLRWRASKLKVDLLGAAAAMQRRAYQQLLASAATLGLAELAENLDPVNANQATSLPRPQFVLRDPGRKDVLEMLAGAEAGVLLVDGRRMPSLAGFGINYDRETATLLNAAAAGDLLELPDPRLPGSIRMRSVTASVIGVLATVDGFGLHEAKRAMLAATMFVPAAAGTTPHPGGNAAPALTEALGRVRELAAAEHNVALPLRLSAAARKVEEQAKTNLTRAAAEVLPPLADYYGGAADLVRRIAGALHLLDHAGHQVGQLPAEVGKDVVLRSVAFVEQCALPAARNILAATSVVPEVRNGRRILSYAQQYCGAEVPLKQQDVARIFQRSMPAAAVHRAVARLVADGLLRWSNSDAAGNGNVLDVSEVVFRPDNQLPDLVTDPRRPRQ